MYNVCSEFSSPCFLYMSPRELLCVPDVPGICFFMVVYTSKQSNLFETKLKFLLCHHFSLRFLSIISKQNKIKQPVKLPYNFLSYLGVCLGNL